MKTNKRAGTGLSFVQKAVLVAVLILITIFLLQKYARTDALDTCVGTCQVSCSFPSVQISKTCYEKGVLQEGKVCCGSLDVYDEKEETTTTEDKCATVHFPNILNETHRFGCRSTNLTQTCERTTATLSNLINACNHANETVKNLCCGENVQTQEEPITPPQINIRIGESTSMISSLFTDTEYRLRIDTKGSHVEKCEAIFINNLNNEKITEGTLAQNITENGNCDDKEIKINITKEDLKNLINPATGAPETTLKITLTRRNQEPYERTQYFIIMSRD